MKPARRTDSASQSCSCTSCIYKSESEQPSIRKYVAHGSRIDRLYYGKYIPLRERKLLNRLVRTRAVYDDLRARLISDSTLSLEKNADLTPGKHHQVIKPLDSEKSGAILEIVDIIGKGIALGPKKLSECCSCCSCSSKRKKIDQAKKIHRRKRAFARTYEEEYGQTGQIGTGGVYTKTYEKEYGIILPGRMGERFKRGVRFKAKHIRSDPCACTFKFSGLIKKHSKDMFRNIRPLPLDEPFFYAEEQYITKKNKKQNLAKKSIQKYKELQDKLEQDMKKLNESKENIKQNVQLHAKKSLEQAKQLKHKIKQNFETGVRKSIQAVKALNLKDKPFESIEEPEIETTFKIKKDSIVKFKDHLKRKQLMKDWECDLECKPEICIPDECFKVLKLKRKHKPKHQDRKHITRYELINREEKVGGLPISRSNSVVQTGNYAITTERHIKKQKPLLRDKGTNRYAGKGLTFESKEIKKVNMKKGAKKVADKSEDSSAISDTFKDNDFPNIKSRDHFHRKKETLKEKELRLARKDKSGSRGRQAVRIKSSFSFDLEFYKNPPGSNPSKVNPPWLKSQPSGIHMHAPRRKRGNIHRHRIKHGLIKPSVTSSQGTLERHKSRLIETDKFAQVSTTSQQEPLIYGSQCECKKHLSNVKTNTAYESKSVSSLTNKSMLSNADKNVIMEVKQKNRLSQVSLLPAHPKTLTSGINKSNSNHNQAVRIGSTFSFIIEFNKNNSRNELKPSSIKEKVKQTRIKNKHVTRKLVQMRGTSARAYHQAKTTLRRCFCTLKLQGHGKTKRNKNKTSTISTVSCLCETKAPLPAMMDKYVETKDKNRIAAPKILLSYECQPGVCVPGECDPILCKKILELRKGKQKTSKSIGSYTGSRRTKSTSSIVSRPFSSAKTKIVQSTIVPTKTVRTSAPRKYKDKLKHNELYKINMNSSERQAVRIGSSFSFNIEFYKGQQTAGVAIAKKPSFSSEIKEMKYKQRKLKDNGYQNDKNNNKSLFTRVISLDKKIRPSFKRCFCTLKLHKNKGHANKKNHKAAKVPANTQTVSEIPIGENKSTKTKNEHVYRVLPFECEPYICIPGECDPYICLQKIEKRELNTREVSAFTDKAEMRSMSSLTENSLKKSEAVLVQPKLFRKGTNIKTNYVKSSYGKQPAEETFKDTKSKQAVRVGSNFNFSIEFSKQLPGALNNKYLKKKQFHQVHSKKDTDKRITITKLRVDHVDTQVFQPRKINRASLVRPMLKRCFCTLNLQNKIKQHQKDLRTNNFGPKAYTVGRAFTTKAELIAHSFGSQINAEMQLFDPKNKVISLSTSSFLLNKYVKSLKSKHGTLKLYSSLNNPINLKQPLIIKSNLSLKVDIVRQLGLCQESRLLKINHQLETSCQTCMNEEYHECSDLFNQELDHNSNKITGLSRYLDKCFCTMNVQILNKKRINNKLKPYECEPGICIPGECNPYECEKLIMRRFAKHLQKSSGTNSMNKSVSSYVTSNASTGLGSKSAQMQTYVKRLSHESLPQKYKPQRQHEQKQAVRIMSSYSLNLEFYKNRSQPFEKFGKALNRKIHKAVNIGAQEKKMHHKDVLFQPTVMSVDKSTAPAPNRCFCTLKLQKKGRIRRDNTIIQTKRIPSIVSRNVKIGTNTKYRKIPIESNDFEFYECEPGICIPGECDPYKCLELMKKRKDLGINTVRMKRHSVTSMNNELKGKYKTRAVDKIPIRTQYTSTKAIKYIKHMENESPHVSGRRSRQAFRIGSNLSFNIEFYKDKPKQQIYNEINLQKKNLKRSEIMARKKFKSPSSKSVSLKFAEKESPLKRLPSSDQHNNNKTFKEKCYCILGLRSKQNKKSEYTEKNVLQSKGNKSYQPTKTPNAIRNKRYKSQQTAKKIPERGRAYAYAAEKTIQTAKKSKNTNHRHSFFLPLLESYECEPGVCIPGQCDPYLCEKIINQRIAIQNSKRSNTESVRTQSVSSTFDNNKQAKNERTQISAINRQKHMQHTSHILPPSDKMTFNADKGLVRIGSNFSFNIEIYKENVNGSDDKEKIKKVKKYPSKNLEHVIRAHRNNLKSTGTVTSKIIGERNNESQVKKIRTKPLGVNPLVKRCFYTLKLMKKPFDGIDQTKNANRLDTEPIKATKSVEAQSNKPLKDRPLIRNNLDLKVLSPYECEPFVCVPGECNPVECLKLIKKRQQVTKEFGTVTEYPKRKSIGNLATRTKDQNLQAKHPNIKPNVQKWCNVDKSMPEICNYQPRQAVKIGSNFSFNIEFFKDMGNNLPHIVTRPPLEDLNIQNYSRKTPQNHTKSQSSYFNHDVHSQLISKKQQSTGTAMANLKRCFCTLSLRNKKLNQQRNESIKMQNNNLPKARHSNVGNFLKKCICTLNFNKVGKHQNQPPTPAVKYEIRGTSTRSRRIPDYIKRPIKTEPYECEPYVCVPGECNPYECLKLIQRRQVRDFGTDYNRYLKDSATDSMKQPLTKSAKAQYQRKQKFNSKGTLASKSIRRSRETLQYSSLPSHNKNRQVVRIGSNFSFNVEFFKDHGDLVNNKCKDDKNFRAGKVTRMKTSKLKAPKKQRTKSRGSIRTVKHHRDTSSQCSASKKIDVVSVANVAPKRCFCTLKLIKKPKSIKPETVKVLPSTTTKNKMTATKMKYTIPHKLDIYECPPFMCIPGKCNPYECLDKMNRREIIRKSRNVCVCTRPTKTLTASVGSRALNVKVHKILSHQARKRNSACASHSEPQSAILESPRIIDNSQRRNKRAVRIGSNFNFNVEFFKQKSQPTFTKIFKTRTNEEEKNYLSKNVTAEARKVCNYNSEIDGAKLKDQASDAGNLLKKCFCTLQLKKSTRQEMAHINMQRPGINVKYPQIFTVGRVAVDPFHKILGKNNPSKKTFRIQSTSINPKLLNRTVGTKTDKVYLRNAVFSSSRCYPSNCPDYQKKIFGRKTKNDNNMQTILPYTPSKFNKKESLPCLADKKRFNNNNIQNSFNEEGNKTINDVSMLGKGKRRLTAKKSKKSIPTHSIQKKDNRNASFFCRCVRFFSRRSETCDEKETNKGNHSEPKQSRSRRQPAKLKFVILPKKAKSFDANCPVSCPDNTKETGKKQFHSKLPQMRVTFADNSKYSKNGIINKKANTSVYSKSSTQSRLCYSCSLNDCPLKYKNLKGDNQKSGDHGKKSNKKSVSYSESADDCQYCYCCKRKIDTDEIIKGGGDRQLTLSSQYKRDTDTCPCGKESFNGNERKNSLRKKSIADKLSQKYFEKQDSCIKGKPLLEMKLDAINHDIINKGEVKQIINEFGKQSFNFSDYEKQKGDKKFGYLKTEHGNLCTCCQCTKKRENRGAKLSVAAKGATNMRTTFAKLFPEKINAPANLLKIGPTKPSGKNRKPCICGSKKCAAESKKKIQVKPQVQKMKFGKPCVCGSSICTTESKKLKRKKEKMANKAKRQAQSIKFKKDRMALLRRVKVQEDKDEVRRRKRIKRNKELEAKVKKYKNAGDLMLATDSLLDIGKLGLSTLTGALRYTTKAVYDPKVACERLCKRCRKTEPETLMKQLEKNYIESDAASTLRRLKMRCLLMNRVQTLKQKLEGNPVTHFILHMADKNPKTRQFKRKPVRRVREPLDFQCSLYMATLRKRPYLSVYYKWPWFYPHFITMLNIWRQFTDIMLFLLAAVVWSPCILCMEGCRALMCCFFCTG